MKNTCFRCIALDVNYKRAECKLGYSMSNCVPLEDCPKPLNRLPENIPSEFWAILGIQGTKTPTTEEIHEKFTKFKGDVR